MKKIFKPVLFSCILFSFLCACESTKENLLSGKWQATQLLEEDSLLQIDTTEIWFTFDRQNRYTFHSTLNYKEAGIYKQNGNLLYTTDTLKTNAKRKAVKVLKLEENLLQLEMEDQGKKRILSLSKEHIEADK